MNRTVNRTINRPVKSSAALSRRGAELDDDQVVSDELILRLVQASVPRVPEVVAGLTLAQRANLARFCYRKVHLHRIGLAIAATCDQSALINAWGTALGRALFAQSREPAQPETIRYPGRREITLGHMPAPARTVHECEDDDIADWNGGEGVVTH
jgi:hypothetical protein